MNRNSYAVCLYLQEEVHVYPLPVAGRCFLLRYRFGVKILVAVNTYISPQGTQQTPFIYVLLNLIANRKY